MKAKLVGGTLLVIGTTIGAGILALPVATAEMGFWSSIILLCGAWLVMTTCAFLFLEVNLWMPPNTNLITMAGATLGKGGQAVSWIVYSFLLYSLICAYIAGGGDLFHYLLNTAGIPASLPVSGIVFTLFFGSIVYLGMNTVDYVNRGLMFGKMGAYILLVLLMLPSVSSTNLGHSELAHIASPSGIKVAAVAFASLMIIPSLRTYFGDDLSSLRKSIFIGMLIPLFCYIAWDLVIMGIIPLDGDAGLKKMLHSSSTNSDVVMTIGALLQQNTVTTLAKFFTSICMTTSFLSISLSLSDFLYDGLGMAKHGKNRIFIFLATFMPPLIVVLFFPGVFIHGLEYAGVCCFFLMILLPPLMVWRGRYHFEFVGVPGSRSVMGGKLLLAVLMLFATLMIGLGLGGTM